MTPMKKKDCETLAGDLKSLGWTPCTGKVMSFGEVLGHKIGILVKVGDERLSWVQPAKSSAPSETAHSGLANFFAAAHVVAKNRPLATQPLGFSSTMAGDDMVEISPGPNESLSDFLSKIKKISTVQVQLGFGFDEPLELQDRVIKAQAAAAMVKSINGSPSSQESFSQRELSIEPERPSPSMRP